MTLCQNHPVLSFIDWVTSGLQGKHRSSPFPGVTGSGTLRMLSGLQTLPTCLPHPLLSARLFLFPPLLGVEKSEPPERENRLRGSWGWFPGVSALLMLPPFALAAHDVVSVILLWVGKDKQINTECHKTTQSV